MFQKLYDNAESCVRINRNESDMFPINAGVRQGCVAALDLFNCKIDNLMTAVCNRVTGIHLDDFLLTDLDYADDTVIFCNTLAQLKDALLIFDQEATRLSLKVNWSKTKLMHVGDGPHPNPIIIDNEPVEFVDTFVYLGSGISSICNFELELNRRRNQASGVMRSLWRPLWKRQDISRRTKLRVYNAAVLSVLLYGAESWPLSKSLAKRLHGFDSRALRSLEGIRWHDFVSNVELRRRTTQPDIRRLAAQRRIRWLGHVLRCPPEHPTKAILRFDPRAAGWRRPEGRPRTRWLDVLRLDLGQVGITLENAPNIAPNRTEWRRLVHLVGSTPSWQEL